MYTVASMQWFNIVSSDVSVSQNQEYQYVSHEPITSSLKDDVVCLWLHATASQEKKWGGREDA